MLPNIEAASTSARCATDQYNLRTIGTALQTYHDHHGQFPPIDKLNLEENLSGTSYHGKPIHYLAVTGKDTAWGPDGKKCHISEIKDPAQTAIVIGVVNQGRQFEETRTVPLEDLVSGKISWEKQIATYPYQQNRFSRWQPSASLLMADGTVRSCIGTPTSEELRRLFSIHDKKPLETGHQDCTGSLIYFASGTPEASRFTVRVILYRVWQLSLVLLFVGIFLPRRRRVEPDSS